MLVVQGEGRRGRPNNDIAIIVALKKYSYLESLLNGSNWGWAPVTGNAGFVAP